jgi:hypothetical protein
MAIAILLLTLHDGGVSPVLIDRNSRWGSLRECGIAMAVTTQEGPDRGEGEQHLTSEPILKFEWSVGVGVLNKR